MMMMMMIMMMTMMNFTVKNAESRNLFHTPSTFL